MNNLMRKYTNPLSRLNPGRLRNPKTVLRRWSYRETLAATIENQNITLIVNSCSLGRHSLSARSPCAISCSREAEMKIPRLHVYVIALYDIIMGIISFLESFSSTLEDPLIEETKINISRDCYRQ